jgi:hypothetical protein
MPSQMHCAAGVLSAEETSTLHQILAEICDQFGFAQDDKAAREQIADALVALANRSARDTETARRHATEAAMAIQSERGLPRRTLQAL